MKLAKQIYPLTSLRFFAALLVVLHHTLPVIVPSIARHGWSSRLQTFTGTTVLLFFILSGYVLALVYLEPGTAIDRKNFWRARFARIYPLYFLALALDTPNLFHARLVKYGLSAAVLKTSVTFAGSCLLLQQWLPMLKGLDFPNWSLSVEALFYAVFPLLGRMLWRRALRVQLALALSCFVIFWATDFVAAAHHLPAAVREQPLSYLPYFISGVVIASLHRWLRAQQSRLTRVRALAPAAALFATVLLIAACSLRLPLPDSIVPGLVFLPAYSVLLVCFAVGNPMIEAVFSRPLLVLLGEASYALYLLHVIVWTWLFQAAGLPINPWTYALYLATALGLSIACFRWVEVPARQYLLRAWRERSRESEAAASLAQ
jgi:peptidoglycan/LPS O-acetylase OafA/YrhL